MKRVFFLLLFTAICKFVVCQTTPNALAFPSGNNNFLGKIGIIPTSSNVNVDLYSGSLILSIPICDLPSKEISIPVSLNYVGGKGIKVQDYATCVGLGWQLNAGGAISRVVRGYPDEQSNGYIGPNSYGQQISSVISTNSAIPSIFAPSGYSSPQPQADGEPDIFYVKTPFFTFQFVFDGSGNAIVSNTNGIKVNFINNHTSFQVIDDNGNQYYFGSTSASIESTVAKLYGTDYTFPTTWYLDRIVSYNAKDNINISYQQAPNNDTTYNYQKTRFYVSGTAQIDQTPTKNITIGPKYISQISSSLGEVDFGYNWTGRLDDPNAAMLSSITIKAYNPQLQTTSSLFKTFNFQYGYFGGGPNTPDPTNTLRLYLDHITLAGNTTETTTPITFKSFSYNTTVNLPSRQSQYFDYWGYYTNLQNPLVTSTTDPLIAPFLRIPFQSYTAANILTKVIDIDGSSKTINYELNDYYKTSNGTNANVQVGGLRVNSIVNGLPTGETTQTSYKYTDAAGNSTGQILTESYNNLIFYLSAVLLLSEQINFSQTPSLIYDINGSFVGYSSVQVTQQNGGYTVSKFTNFNDFPDALNTTSLNPYSSNIYTAPIVTSSISLAYKRGLLLDQSNYTSSGRIISETTNQYSSLTNPVQPDAYGYHPFFVQDYDLNGSTYNYNYQSKYWYYIENYRLTQTVQTDYDQNNINNFVQTTTTYSYLNNSTVSTNNNRTVKSITTTNSKGNTVTKTFYHPDDPTTPMLTSSEQTAITAMVNANRLGLTVHETNNNNGAITQSHNSFSTGSATNNNGYANTYLTSTTSYNGTTQVGQQLFNYNLGTSNLSSSYILNGKPTSLIYDYNFSYPVAKVVNANSTYAQTQGTGGFGTVFTGYYSTSFTVGYTGTISWNLYFNGYPGSGTVLNINYNLNGPTTRSGNLCMSLGGSCPNYASASFTNMPIGTYYISFYVSGGSASIYCNGSYPQLQSNFTNEFYFEGFEQGTYSTITGGAHTGNAYYNNSGASYYLPFVLPNGRSYTLQYWSLVNGVWVFNEQPYTGPQYIAGMIDDVRVFPSDALITTYTYNPLIGKTGETDPSGRTVTYEYDGFGRQSIVRDNDKNIVSKTCYSYVGQTVPCIAVATVPITICCNGSGNSWGVSLTNTVTGQVYSQGIPITPSYNIGTSFNIPPGTYNVSIYWQYMGQGSVSGPTGGPHLLNFGAFSQYGTNSLSISNLTITSPLTVSIPF